MLDLIKIICKEIKSGATNIRDWIKCDQALVEIFLKYEKNA